MLFKKKMSLKPFKLWIGKFRIVIHLINPFKAQILPGIRTICLDLLNSGRSANISYIGAIAVLRGKGQADRHYNGEGR